MSIIRTDTITNSAGTGAPNFPNGLTVNSLPIPTPIDRQTFTATGNWNKPVGAKLVFVRVWGAGGGGGSGQLGGVNTNRFGGGGGGGGAYYDQMYSADVLPSVVSVTIGLGGTGGATQSNTGNGNAGNNGGPSSFGALIVCEGGFGGWPGSQNGVSGSQSRGGGAQGAGQNASATIFAHTLFGATNGVAAYYGGASGGISIGGIGFNSRFGGGGGGVGGWESSANALQPATAGGLTLINTTQGLQGGGGVAGTSNDSAPTNGGNGTSIGMAGGGGGSGQSASTNAGNGGNGAIAGGGGGGGSNLSGSLTRFSGAGGNGGNGYVEVYSW